jgi:hypothetical protein
MRLRVARSCLRPWKVCSCGHLTEQNFLARAIDIADSRGLEAGISCEEQVNAIKAEFRAQLCEHSNRWIYRPT